ncbi:GNAT family N-acetyltransferase [Heyndrickxia acidiproducens]|uniref:GNAT family N-acetyltransferase n=1 Tax=Heyndrickxia acidiproducens TaxID=1121084 RepID=UPI000379CB15|nr:GNAT family N-acetyltransferase [Heyndrickxia acidiproducens]
MEIREPNQVEFEQIMQLSPQAIYDGTLGETRPAHGKIKQLIKKLLENGCYYIIAVADEQLLGWILVGSSKDQFSDQLTGFIYELFVKEEYRSRGIAKQLMLSAINRLKTEGYSEIRLSAYANNPAIKLYENLGFKVRTVSMCLTLKKLN